MDNSKLIAALVGPEVDVEAALAEMERLGLPLEFSVAAVDLINDEANRLSDQAAEMKLAEAPRSQRKIVKSGIDRLVNARAFVYRLCPAQSGDVVVGR